MQKQLTDTQKNKKQSKIKMKQKQTKKLWAMQMTHLKWDYNKKISIATSLSWDAENGPAS